MRVGEPCEALLHLSMTGHRMQAIFNTAYTPLGIDAVEANNQAAQTRLRTPSG